MSKYRYEAGGIRDLELDIPYYTDDIVDLLTGKDIRITELQKKLEEKEKDNQFLKKMYLSEKQKNDNYHTEKYGLDKPVEELRKIKLTPKEKEVYYKGFDNCERQFATHIAELQKRLAEKDKEIEELKESKQYFIVNYDHIVNKLQKQLKSQPAEIVEKIKEWGQKHYNWVGDGTGYDGQDYNECIGFNMAIDQLNEVLDKILKKYQKENK